MTKYLDIIFKLQLTWQLALQLAIDTHKHSVAHFIICVINNHKHESI